MGGRGRGHLLLVGWRGRREREGTPFVSGAGRRGRGHLMLVGWEGGGGGGDTFC